MSIKIQDTDLDSEAKQIELIRKATVARRLKTLVSLSETTIHLSKRAISRANPEYNQLQIDLAFIALHYGNQVASSVKNMIGKRDERV